MECHKGLVHAAEMGFGSIGTVGNDGEMESP